MTTNREDRSSGFLYLLIALSAFKHVWEALHNVTRIDKYVVVIF